MKLTAARASSVRVCAFFLFATYLCAIHASAATSSRFLDTAIQAAVETDPQMSPRTVRRALKHLAQEGAQALAGASTSLERRLRFNKFLFGDTDFKGENDQTSTGGLLLHRVLERRRGTCVGLAQVYLILAERLSLPVVAAATPTHLFARWLEDGGHVNVELLEGGAEVSDAAYRERHRIREADPAHPVYLRDLGAPEVLARVYNNLGVIRSRAGLLDAATSTYARAIDLDPRFSAPYYNRGLDHLSAGRPAEALRDFDSALAIYPSDTWALNNRGLARLALGQANGAVEDFERALAFDPGLNPARKNLRIARLRAVENGTQDGSKGRIPAEMSDPGEPTGPRP